MSNLNEVFDCANSMGRMAEAIEELTWEKGPEFSQVKGIAVGIMALSDKATAIIEDMEGKQSGRTCGNGH